jgi:predicted molibdopterin-dependent oxidoreductase YjgC
MIILAGADPVINQPVASFLIKRTVDKGIRLIVVDDGDNGLEPFAFMNLKMSDMKKAVDIAARAENPVVLYGSSLSEKAADALKELAGKARFIALEQGVNTCAAAAFGMNNGFNPSAVKLLYLVAGEDNLPSDSLDRIGRDAFIVVQTSFNSDLNNKADVVLPAAIWSEQAGSLTNIEGRIQKLQKAVEPKGEAKADWEIAVSLASKLGKKLGGSLDEVTARATEILK